MYLKVNSFPSFFPTFTGKTCKFHIEMQKRSNCITLPIPPMSLCVHGPFFWKRFHCFWGATMTKFATMQTSDCSSGLIPKSNWGLAAQVSTHSLVTLLIVQLKHDRTVYLRCICVICYDLWAQDGVRQHAFLLLAARVGTKSKERHQWERMPVFLSALSLHLFLCMCVCVCVHMPSPLVSVMADVIS